MSATSKLRPRSSPETEGRPVLRPAGNTTSSVPRKALTPLSKPVTAKLPLCPTKNSPRLPVPTSKTSPLKPSAQELPESLRETFSDGHCEDGEKEMESEEAKDAVSKKHGSGEKASRGKWNAVSRASDNAVAKPRSNAGRKSPGTNIQPPSSSPDETSMGHLDGLPSVQVDTKEQRRLKLAASGRKQGSSPKTGRVVPDGLPASPVAVESMKRCGWITSGSGPAYVAYHDTEWGVPIHDDRKLFELFVLVGAQAEVAWPTILERREIYRSAFAGFDPAVVAKFDDKMVTSLKANSSIMQHEGKIRGVIENAIQVLKIEEEFGSFDKYLWGFVNNKPIVSKYRFHKQVPVKTPKSELICKDLMKRGFRFVGPTIMYSFMQAVGMANDHLVTCFRYDECNKPQQVGKCIIDQVLAEAPNADDEIYSVASLYAD